MDELRKLKEKLKYAFGRDFKFVGEQDIEGKHFKFLVEKGKKEIEIGPCEKEKIDKKDLCVYAGGKYTREEAYEYIMNSDVIPVETKIRILKDENGNDTKGEEKKFIGGCHTNEQFEKMSPIEIIILAIEPLIRFKLLDLKVFERIIELR